MRMTVRRGGGEVRRKESYERSRRVRRREKNYSCMLLGNNLWSLKAANMADLALLVFHFGECSSSSPPIYPSSLLRNLNFSLPPTFLLTLHPLSPPSPLMPPPPCCLYASKLSLPSSSLSLHTFLHLTYFSVSSSFQHISALLGSMQRRVTEGG